MLVFESDESDSRRSLTSHKSQQGFGAGAARSRGIWLEPEPSLWPGSSSGSGSTLIICLIIHENYMELNII